MKRPFYPTSKKQNRYYVYILKNPLTGEPIYVGKGTADRALSHLYRRGKDSLSQFILNMRKTHLVEVHISYIIRDITEEEAFRIEREHIMKIGRKSNGTGPLLNKTNGTSPRKKSQVLGFPAKYIHDITQQGE